MRHNQSNGMNLLSDGELERSAVVANCRMNRERNLAGSNGYDRELGFPPLEFLRSRNRQPLAWLDLCCGTGKALIQAARIAHAECQDLEITGVDLVGMFERPDAALTHLNLLEASLTNWRPFRPYDLITCVHGLHYVGNKLGLIARAGTWLTADGLFVANLDLDNIKTLGERGPVVARLRQAGLEYHRSCRRVLCRGYRLLSFPYRYLGANDQAGPNYTGQPAVNSYYEAV